MGRSSKSQPKPRKSRKSPGVDGSPPQVTADQVRWYRLRKSGLAGTSFVSPGEAAGALFGVQAQINSAGRLALWHRLASSESGDVDQTKLEIETSIQDKKTLVRLWGQRGTLHLYATDDWPLVCSAMGAREIAHIEQRRRRDTKVGLTSHESACRLALKILKRRPDYQVSKALLEGEGTEAEVKALYGALLTLCMKGHGCRIDTGDNAPAVLAWRSKRFPKLVWKLPPFEKAMVEMARRFFSAYGPATEADFRYWLSANASESRAAVQVLHDSNELADVIVDDGRGGQDSQLVKKADLPMLMEKPPAAEEWPVRLLGRFDPLLLAHVDKTCWVDRKHYQRVWHHTHVEPVLLVQGRIRGVWRYERKVRGLTINLQLFDTAALSSHFKRGLQGQAEGVARFFGVPLLAVNTSVMK